MQKIRMLCFVLLWPGLAWAEMPDIFVVGLFADNAVVMIDGKQRLMKRGQKSPEGVVLVSADSESATFRFEGGEVRLRLDGRISAPVSRPSNKPEVKVWRDTSGMFTTAGSINGMPVSFLVDTGASSVAMNSAEARRLGLAFRVQGTETRVRTASGVERAYALVLDRVKVGGIQLRNVEAVVIDGAQPERALLGMSFLGQLEMVNEGTVMTLKKKY